MELKLTIIGRVGRDPDLREVSGGKKVCSYSVATSPQKDKTVWVNVSTWNRRAEIDAQYLKKGMLVKCEGTIQTDENGKPRTYEKDGIIQSAGLEMTAYDVKYLIWNVEETQKSDSVNTKEEIPF